MTKRLYSGALISALGVVSLLCLGEAANAQAINANPYKDGELLDLELSPDKATTPATQSAKPQSAEPHKGRGDSIDDGAEGG